MRNQKKTLWDGTEMKILTPLTGDFFPKEESGWEDEFDGDREQLDGRDLMQYRESIQKAVDRENSPEEEGGDICNLMEYFRGSDSIKEKSRVCGSFRRKCRRNPVRLYHAAAERKAGTG